MGDVSSQIRKCTGVNTPSTKIYTDTPCSLSCMTSDLRDLQHTQKSDPVQSPRNNFLFYPDVSVCVTPVAAARKAETGITLNFQSQSPRR